MHRQLPVSGFSFFAPLEVRSYDWLWPKQMHVEAAYHTCTQSPCDVVPTTPFLCRDRDHGRSRREDGPSPARSPRDRDEQPDPTARAFGCAVCHCGTTELILTDTRTR